MQTTGLEATDLRRFSHVQQLAHDVVEEVQLRLRSGMTEKDAVRMLRAEPAAPGCRSCSRTGTNRRCGTTAAKATTRCARAFGPSSRTSPRPTSGGNTGAN